MGGPPPLPATQGWLELGLLAQLVAPDAVAQHGCSLAGLCAALLGMVVDKGQQRSSWGAPRLSKASRCGVSGGRGVPTTMQSASCRVLRAERFKLSLPGR
jgi:hypothetical protein